MQFLLSLGKIISIHALLAESDSPVSSSCTWLFTFQSTLSLRRATKALLPVSREQVISIHALLAESDQEAVRYGRKGRISIHALLAESDHSANRVVCGEAEFQSTLSLRRATICRIAWTIALKISIHALLAESDPPDRRLPEGDV